MPGGSPALPQGRQRSSRLEAEQQLARREAIWRSCPLPCAPAQALLPAYGKTLLHIRHITMISFGAARQIRCLLSVNALAKRLV